MNEEKQRWSADHIRKMCTLYAHTDHNRFENQTEEAAYYSRVIGRRVPETTVGRLKNGQWYEITPSGEIQKSAGWPTRKREEPEQPGLFFPEIETSEPARARLAEVLATMGELMEQIEALSAEAAQLFKELKK